MLNVARLKQEIQKAFDETLPPAFEQGFLQLVPQSSQDSKDRAKQFGETINNLISEALADRIANAIDYYVKNAQIFGTIITVGSMVTQTAMINSTPTPAVNGSVPNTLGIM